MQRLGVVLVAIQCLLCAPASAQTVNEAATARQLFRQGIEATREHRWYDAVEAFSRSYQIDPKPATLLNLAGVQEQAGALVEALDAYHRYLNLPAEASTPRRDVARQAIAELEPRVPWVTISVGGWQDGDRVELDRRPIAEAALGAAYPLNPGTHTAQLIRDGQVVGVTTLDVLEGQRIVLSLVARPVDGFATARRAADSEVPSFVDPNKPADDEAGPGLSAGTLLWTIAGVILAAGVIVGTIAVVDALDTPDRYQGNLPGGSVEF